MQVTRKSAMWILFHPSQEPEEKCGKNQADPKGRQYSEYPLPQVPTNGVMSSARRDQEATNSKEAVDSQWTELSERVTFEPAQPYSVIQDDCGR